MYRSSSRTIQKSDLTSGPTDLNLDWVSQISSTFLRTTCSTNVQATAICLVTRLALIMAHRQKSDANLMMEGHLHLLLLKLGKMCNGEKEARKGL